MGFGLPPIIDKKNVFSRVWLYQGDWKYQNNCYLYFHTRKNAAASDKFGIYKVVTKINHGQVEMGTWIRLPYFICFRYVIWAELSYSAACNGNALCHCFQYCVLLSRCWKRNLKFTFCNSVRYKVWANINFIMHKHVLWRLTLAHTWYLTELQKCISWIVIWTKLLISARGSCTVFLGICKLAKYFWNRYANMANYLYGLRGCK